MRLFVIIGCVAMVYGGRLDNIKTVGGYLNVCLDGRNHKWAPSRESRLYQQCYPWRANSCCTNARSRSLHTSKTWYKLDLNHCPGYRMSERCQRHFLRDMCFYECSPNLGPWLVPEEPRRSWRNEKPQNVPLCRSECVAWWNDCKWEHTCLDNWAKGGFDYSSGINTCPKGSECRTFNQVFKTADNFCESIWDNSWRVVADDQPCMKLKFHGSNPNTKVAREKADELIKGKGTVIGWIKRVFKSIFDWFNW